MEKYKNIHILKLASSTEDQRYLLSCNEIHYEANYAIAKLIEILQNKDTINSAIDVYINQTDNKYTSKQVLHIITNVINPILINTTDTENSFIYEKKLFNEKTIDTFSDRFYFLFKKKYIISVLLIISTLDIYFFLTTSNLFSFSNNINIYMIFGLFAFMLLSSFFHELGHASACKHFNVKHGGIGFGLYLNFPVLYTDVSEVWKLDRIQRCVVNIAGVYFQSYWLIILLIGFFLTGNDILRYLILIMNFGFLMTLNPFFKFDGYWMASDLLGVPNLRARSKELLSYWYKRMRKQSITQKPYLLQIRPAAKYGLLIYSIVVNLFMGFYFFYIIPSFLYRFVCTFPDAVNELILYLSNRMTPPFALLRNIGSQLLFLTLIGYMLWKLAQPLLKRYVKK